MIVVNKLSLYLDNCCFNRPFDDQLQLKIRLETEAKIHIQQEILDGVYELVWSYVLDYENALSPFLERKSRIARWKDIAFVSCYENNAILMDAENLVKNGVKMLDALHVACAVYANCDYFITTDLRLLRKAIKGVQLIDPIEFIKRECV